MYLLVGDRTRAVAVDFDHDDIEPVAACHLAARGLGLPTYVERSKSKGYHVWFFLDTRGVLAGKARALVRQILEAIGLPRTEVFPKQDQLDGRTAYGNYIYAPLFGALVTRGRTVFLNPDRGFHPHKDQWSVLEAAKRISEAQLDDVLATSTREVEAEGLPPVPHAPHAVPSPTYHALPPCARRMLALGVTEFQRVSCFRLAVHLRKAGLPLDLAVRTLLGWAAKNRPVGGKRIISPPEVDRQTRDAYEGAYRGCGCEDPAIQPFCDPHCPVLVGSLPAQDSTGGTKPSAPRRTAMSNTAPARPIKAFHAGTIRASIWRNEVEQDGRTVVRHSIRIDKDYFDAQRREWQRSECLFVNDLPRVRLVAEKAFEFITLREREPDAEIEPAPTANEEVVSA